MFGVRSTEAQTIMRQREREAEQRKFSASIEDIFFIGDSIFSLSSVPEILRNRKELEREREINNRKCCHRGDALGERRWRPFLESEKRDSIAICHVRVIELAFRSALAASQPIRSETRRMHPNRLLRARIAFTICIAV